MKLLWKKHDERVTLLWYQLSFVLSLIKLKSLCQVAYSIFSQWSLSHGEGWWGSFFATSKAQPLFFVNILIFTQLLVDLSLCVRRNVCCFQHFKSKVFSKTSSTKTNRLKCITDKMALNKAVKLHEEPWSADKTDSSIITIRLKLAARKLKFTGRSLMNPL